MTTTMFTPPSAAPIPGGAKKKRVLLVDTSTPKRELRAEVMRKLGMDVDCAADIPEARSWWRADLYDLVLINVDKGAGHRDKFCDDIRSATPSQPLAFLVGKPEYLANVPGLDGEVPLPMHHDDSLMGDVKTALSIDLADLSQRWGIMEASRRISAVRSASNARTRAMRDRPTPPRDLEVRHGKRPADEPPSLDDLLREEMQ
ncbi:MAG TPA: response regulator [Terriglobales bacterium]|jgi:CheY-like chemotaxis protein|nr:response regulator [Terriglobales bacterium]